MAKMVEWYTKVMHLLMQEHLTAEKIRLMTRFAKDQIAFRSGSKELFTLAERMQIPLLIFSAGLTSKSMHYSASASSFWKRCVDVIDEVLDLFELRSETTHVISNDMTFDTATGQINGFSPFIIHPLSKGEASLHGKNKSIAAERRNVILMGDHLGDLAMANGVPHDTCLTIGYLNVNGEPSSTNYKAYMDKFDLVIVGDGGLYPLITILKRIEELNA